MILDTVAAAPNPQFVREPMIDLTGEWEFAHDDADEGLAKGWSAADRSLECRIMVPYPPESRLSCVHDTGFHKVIWYRRTFADPRTSEGQQVLLRFGAVDYRATVWVNGCFRGTHEGGSTPFSLNITDAMSGVEGDHVITVRVEDDPQDVEQPRGKQDWHRNPRVIHYHRTSGIWQPVWLEIVPEVYIDSIRWKFSLENWTLAFEATLSGQPMPGSAFAIDLEIEGIPVASVSCSVQSRVVRGAIDVSHGTMTTDRRILLWSPLRPNLFGASLTFTSPRQHNDVVLTYLGLRTIDIEGARVLINGTPIFQRLVLSQGYWPESHLAAPSPEALRREVELILELGFNGARVHQKVEDPRFLFWADRLGLLLWGEIGSTFAYSDRGIDRHSREWREVVTRDRNHPSIVTWVPFNESWGVDDIAFSENQQHAVKAAYHMTHQLDGSRPVVGNDGWENVVGDFMTIHDYTWDPELLEERYGSDASPHDMIESYVLGHRRLVVGEYKRDVKPIILSEFGGVSFAPAEDERWFGYGTVGTTEEFMETYRNLTNAISNSAQLAGYCYTQLTDTGQEKNGLLTENRQPKADMAKLREITIGRHILRRAPWSQ